MQRTPNSTANITKIIAKEKTVVWSQNPESEYIPSLKIGLNWKSLIFKSGMYDFGIKLRSKGLIEVWSAFTTY